MSVVTSPVGRSSRFRAPGRPNGDTHIRDKVAASVEQAQSGVFDDKNVEIMVALHT